LKRCIHGLREEGKYLESQERLSAEPQ